MATTVLHIASESTRHAAGAALRAAGIQVVEAGSLEEARRELAAAGTALAVLDGQALQGAGAAGDPLPRDAARKLSHDLRTPLSAMAGWLHLLESGKLDEAGTKRAIEKLRGNIDDQVRMIDRCLGTNHAQEGR